MPKAYCAVYGCLSSASSKPEISFFKLPADVERRSKWLRLISREDLMDKPPQNYTVCEEHFDTADILPGTHRNKLKTSSLPSLYLPDFQKKDVFVQTTIEVTMVREISTQTEENKTQLKSVSTQTTRSLSSDTPRKKKRKSDHKEARNKKDKKVTQN